MSEPPAPRSPTQAAGRLGPNDGANVAFLIAVIVGVTGVVGSFFIKNSHGLEPQSAQD
ncbi:MULTISPECIES: hypothetical protein [unclassified Brevibacterium]|uniref:hypothetical protein n=1 Tax=unclassified Brevibacterium TaxID=2614124 RepID=UPI001E5C3D15|nr:MULTISPECIES: hypothetical protein [unclassified Brevibacterium]MDK8434533.1 hypothetical protein [Brevibacterium sp. H-BE7]